MPEELTLTPDEIAWAKSQGLDPNDLVPQVTKPVTKSYSTIGAVGKSLQQKAGGIAGAGAGALAAQMVPVAHAFPPWTEIGAGVIGAGVGGFGGQKLQEAVEGEEVAKRLQEEAAQAQSEHPVATTVGDFAVSAAAGGGAFSPSTLVKGVRGAISPLAGRAISAVDKAALQNVAIQSAVMPAINTGIEYATTGELPSAGSIAAQAAGGALFAKPNFLGRMAGRLHEPKVDNVETTEPLQTTPKAEAVAEKPTSDWMKIGEDGKHLIDDAFVKEKFKEAHPAPDADKFEGGAKGTDYYKAKTAWKRTMASPVNEMRSYLNDLEVKKAAVEKATTPVAEPTIKIPEAEPSAEPVKAVTTENSSPVKPVEEPVVPPIAETEADKQTMLQTEINKPEVQEAPLPIRGAKSLGQLSTNEDITTAPKMERSIGTVASELKRIGSMSTRHGELARAMNVDADSAGTQIVMTRDVDGAYYDYKEDKIYLHPNDTNDPTILHEIAHASTIKKMPQELVSLKGGELKKYIDNYLSTGSSESVKEVMRCYLETAKQLKIHDQLFKGGEYPLDTGEDGPLVWGEHKGVAGDPNYAEQVLYKLRGQGYYASDIPEFIAGFFNDMKWRQTLNKLDSGLDDKRNLFSRLHDAISRLLGEEVRSGSMLERVLKPTEELMAQERPGNTTRVATTDASQTVRMAPKTKEESTGSKNPYSFARFLAGAVDRIAIRHNSPTGKMVADNLHRFFGEYDILKGEFGNKALTIVDKYKLTPEQVTKVYQHNHEISNFGESKIALSAEEKSLSEDIKKFNRDNIGKRVQEEGPQILTESGNLRLMKLKKEGYFESVISREVAHEWAENPTSPKSKAQDKAYIDHQVKQGYDVPEATEKLNNYKLALGNRVDRDIAYKAIRRAEGAGLPWELVDQNMLSAMSRYADRVARDVAWYKHVQSDPKMLVALNEPDQQGNRIDASLHPDVDYIGSSEETTRVLKHAHGADVATNPAFMAAARAAGNTVMGVGTAARNITTIPGIAATYMQGKQLSFLWKAVAHMNDSKARALASNAVRPNFQEDFDAAGFRKDEPNPIINLLNKYSSFMRKYQGRDFSDKFEGEYLYSLGELLTTDNIARAQKGDVEARHFLQRFGDIVKGGPETLFKGKVTPDDVQRVAKRFVDATRGTYSAEGLPSWAMEGNLAPFAALSKFSIEKSNTVWKDVVEPMRKGVYGPFIRYALGSLGVGVMIEKMNELLSNKRGVDPTISETMAGLTPEVGVSKAIGLLQLASFAGIVGDGAKAAMQMYQGKELRYNQPLSLPLYTMVTETLMGNAKDAAAAIQDGEDPFEVMGLLATTIAGQSVQSMRYIDANFIHPEEAKRKEKFRDMTTFQTMEGKRAGPVIKSNPFTDIQEKKFKRTGDVGEAMNVLPGIVNKIFAESNGDPYEIQRKLKGLKNNSYQTMPSFENMPVSFVKYLNRLRNTQGEEAANARLEDYVRQNAVNRAKASAVP